MDKNDKLSHIAVVAGVLWFIISVPISAQADGLLDAILGVFGAPPPAASPIREVSPGVVSTPLRIVITPKQSSAFGSVSGYCVRLCDGRYFPLPRLSSNVTPTRLCSALCPAARTMVYWGAPIDQAKALNGSRYSDLATAFYFRKQVESNCTCNGSDNFGTAAISIKADLTLRPGDIVVTENGARVFIGSSASEHETGDFTPVENYSGFSTIQRRQISTIQITRNNYRESNALDFRTHIIVGTTPALSSSLTPRVNSTHDK
jgi:hypothetical protein